MGGFENNDHIAFLGSGTDFPPVETAREDGLLAVGGDLSPERLLSAYAKGIFPWFNNGGMLFWWSPDPRMVLFPEKLKVSKSMRKVLRDDPFTLTRDQCFDRVIEGCAGPRTKGEQGTWIGLEFVEGYGALHRMGHAHSYEVWEKGELVGGLYGVDLGHVFCGESMFSLRSNASKYALIHMVRELGGSGVQLIDCQIHSDHLESLGAELIPRKDFVHILEGKLGGSKQEQDALGQS